ncbi:MAG: hypothetical protein E6G39_16740 [Actinobacteria bacterium]|nr:MAG: hypothetical protein E6G39_16740 [Actinomycetota bacterium]
MDTTEVTHFRWGLIGRARQQLRGVSAGPSLRAQLVLVFSAFLLGAVVSALLFVGIWRHTAAEGDRAQAAQAIAQRRLTETQNQLRTAQRSLGSERSRLVHVRELHARLATELARLRRLDNLVAARLPAQLQSINASAAALSHSTSALESELSALQSYLQTANATGIDTGFVTTQIRYLIRSTQNALSNAAQLNRHVQAAAAVAAPLGVGK